MLRALVKIGGGGRGRGHASLAFAEGGRPLGVLGADTRKPADEPSEARKGKHTLVVWLWRKSWDGPADRRGTSAAS